uniref:Uncharacterized protein n=1 Tax=viral metagenome TaxID=1070528 RepID=A0A6C0CM78_9ZZZZ
MEWKYWIIIFLVVAGLCVGAYFLFKPSEKTIRDESATGDPSKPSKTNDVQSDASQQGSSSTSASGGGNINVTSNNTNSINNSVHSTVT